MEAKQGENVAVAGVEPGLAPPIATPVPPEGEAMEVHHHPHAEHHKTGHRLLDLVLGGSALLLSIISILLAYHTGHNMEKLVHANSWPALQLTTANGGIGKGPGLVFGVQNAGIGPARIHRFELIIGDVVIPDDHPLLLRRILEVCCGDVFKPALARAGDGPAPEGESSRRRLARSFISPKEDAYVLYWPRTEANIELWKAVDEARLEEKIKLRSCYCSVFDECWVSETGKFPPQPVDRCPD